MLVKVLRLGGDERYRALAERLHRDVYKDGFVVEGIRYHPDPCSIGHTSQGGVTGSSAGDYARERSLTDLHVLDMCCGVGVVGLTMCAYLRGDGERRIRKMSFADINIYNLNSLEKTLRQNPSDLWGSVETEAFLTDGLKAIEPAHQFDLIVSNPPHFYTESFTDWTLQPSVLGAMDPGWSFHREFYAVCHEYLSPPGEVWFLENHLAEPEQALKEIIEESPQMEL
ncbi:MAG: methyltransferase, partial [Acidimicrobiales bacterium]